MAIEQINGLLDKLAYQANNINQKSDKLIYYNENNQVATLVVAKNILFDELELKKIE